MSLARSAVMCGPSRRLALSSPSSVRLPVGDEHTSPPAFRNLAALHITQLCRRRPSDRTSAVWCDVAHQCAIGGCTDDEQRRIEASRRSTHLAFQVLHLVHGNANVLGAHDHVA